MHLVVDSADQAAISRLLARPRFGPGHQVTVEFLTDPDTYARLLPPPLEPAERPMMIASVGQWESNCVGTYAGGSITALARHHGIDGGHPVGMWMDSEAAILYGREVFGEPKKLATAHIERRDDAVTASVERHGVRLIEIHAALDTDESTDDVERRTFNFRSRTSPAGDRLAGDATLTLSTFATTLDVHRSGRGELALVPGLLDPICGVPVLEVVRATYQQHTMHASCRGIASVPAADFWPWHLARADDPRLLPRTPVRLD